MGNNHSPVTSHSKWETIISNSTFNWTTIYSNTFTSTIDTKLRNFQFKFLHRAIPTNKLLMKQHIVNCNLCDFCSMYTESIEHLFWECLPIQTFWNDLCNYFKQQGFDFCINYELVCFLHTDKTNHADAKNFILLLAKYYIFINKFRKTLPNLPVFKKYLKSRINIEQHIAFTGDKIEKHNKKWKNIPLT